MVAEGCQQHLQSGWFLHAAYDGSKGLLVHAGHQVSMAPAMGINVSKSERKQVVTTLLSCGSVLILIQALVGMSGWHHLD